MGKPHHSQCHHLFDIATSVEGRHQFREAWGYTSDTLSCHKKKFLNSHDHRHFYLGALKVWLGTVGSMGYLSLWCCSRLQVYYVYIFHTSGFPYSSRVSVCVRLQTGNPLRLTLKGKNLVWGYALMLISKWCWHILRAKVRKFTNK